MKICIEIRAGEGGADARLLVSDQSALYLRYAKRHDVKAAIISQSTSDHG